MRYQPLAILALAAAMAAPLSGAHAQTPAISDANRQKIAANIAEADANRDAMLSYNEFVKLIQLNAEDNIGRAAQIVRTNSYRLAFDRVDADRNGLVSQQELQALSR